MLKILFADDDQDIREALASVITFLGHEATGVDCGDKVLKLIANGFKPDLVILDQQMGNGVTGFSVLCMLKKQGFEAPIVILSGVNDVNLAVKTMKMGACDFIPKPIDISRMEELFNKVSETNQVKTAVTEASLEESEKILILNAVNNSDTYKQAAEKLGINIVTLHRKRKRYNIHKDALKDAMEKIDEYIKVYTKG